MSVASALGCGDDKGPGKNGACEGATCQTPPTTINPNGPCQADANCGAAASCYRGACLSNAILKCEGGKKPIIQVDPASIEFGSIRVATPVARALTVRNLGDCALKLTSASFDPNASTEFACANCTGFPKTLLPSERETINLVYTAVDVTPDTTILSITSDDAQFPLIRVPLKSENKGTPTIAVDPATLNYGYVPQGSTRAQTFTIRNAANGDGVLTVREIANRPLTSTTYRVAPSRTLPAYLNAGEAMTVEVTYAPQNAALHTEAIAIASTDTVKPVVEVAVTGYSATPPSIAVTPTTLAWGNVPLGTTERKSVRVTNNGGSPLTVSLILDQLGSTDFSYSSTIVPMSGFSAPIAPHANADVFVDLTPTTNGIQRGRLVINSNDPATPQVTVDLSGTGAPNVGTDVLKIEMTFDNGSGGWATNDFRNVDLVYENPYGDQVSKANRAPDWGTFGHPRWQSYSAEKPEIIIHADAGGTNGDYKVKVDYVEDCSAAISQLVASILGIATNALIAYLTGGITLPGLDQAIANVCTSHDSSDVQVKVYINGTLTRTKVVNVTRKGEIKDVVTIRRTNGVFNVL